MNKSSKKTTTLIFGLLIFGYSLISLQLFADDKTKKTEPEIIKEAGIGPFDWTGKGNNHKQIPTTPRKVANQELESTVVCPVCDTKDIPVTTIISQRFTLDYDFCEHYVGNSPNIFDLWCCSICGYTEYRKDFSKPVNEEDKAFVKKYLTEAIHKDLKQEYGNLFKDLKSKPLKQLIIPNISKIKNFVAFIDHKNDLDDQWKAFYYVKAIYATRNTIALAPSCTSLNSSFLEISKKLDDEFKIPETDKQQPHVSTFYLSFYLHSIENYKETSKERLALHFLIAQCFNRLGYYTECKNNISKAKAICSKLKDVEDAIKIIKNFEENVELEKSYTLKAVSYMKDALEQKLDYGNNQDAIVYLIGELSRRCEVYSDAYLFLSAAKMIFPNEIPIKSWAEEHLKRKELNNDDFLILAPPAYLKQIVLDHNKK